MRAFAERWRPHRTLALTYAYAELNRRRADAALNRRRADAALKRDGRRASSAGK